VDVGTSVVSIDGIFSSRENISPASNLFEPLQDGQGINEMGTRVELMRHLVGRCTSFQPSHDRATLTRRETLARGFSSFTRDEDASWSFFTHDEDASWSFLILL
jgi:hypothetical protein